MTRGVQGTLVVPPIGFPSQLCLASAFPSSCASHHLSHLCLCLTSAFPPVSVLRVSFPACVWVESQLSCLCLC